jgi:ABC-type lipoprotein release transport system permease subunit
LGGDDMLVGIKDAAKLVGIFIIACCAVLVCTMFINYNMDIIGIKEIITSEQVMIFYEAQVSTAKVVSAVSGGCLLITSVIMLLFYIKHYIDTHKKELGILKALGYSNLKIARNFWTFGISVFLGTALGFIGAFLIMPSFYKVQNEDKILPDISIHFHPLLLVYLVIVPTVAFAILAVCYAWHKLKMPVINLLNDNSRNSSKVKNHKECKSGNSLFLDDLKKNTLRDKKVLVFFIIFASFCFSSMTQMAFSMKDLASFMMGAMIMLIGIALACTTLFLAITTVINGNTKTIAMMRVFGYSQKECCKAILGGYRPMSYIGFAIGTVYQYALLRIMVDIVFKDIQSVPAYKFDFPVMLISLAAFIVLYEIVMYTYSVKIRKISIKEIMLEY